MKLGDLYSKVMQLGMEKDVRPKRLILKQREAFADTKVLHGSLEINVKRVLVGIDINGAEVLIADRIRQKDGLDLVIAHHPEGSAWASFFEVMSLQIDMLEKLGIDREVARSLLEERKFEVERRILAANHQQNVDAARLLNMPLMCIHTPADNFVTDFLQRLIDKRRPVKVGAIIDLLREIPEYAKAARNNAGPKVILGSPNRRAGKVFVDMTGGTEGSKEVFGRLYKAGVRTLLCMHLSEEHFKKAKDEGVNVIIAGHISSDTLGINLLLDALEESFKEKLEVINCSGFTRISRNGI